MKQMRSNFGLLSVGSGRRSRPELFPGLLRAGVGLGLAAGLIGLVGCGAMPDDDDYDTFTALYDGYFQECSSCHAPDAPGFTSGTEATLDFTTVDTAYSSITSGSASGLTGNQEGCNGVPFVGDSPDTSLILAVLDENVRGQFQLADYPDCDADAISDMTVKVGSQPDATFMDDLEMWLESRTTSAVARQGEER